jgi:hypothetical protein
MDCYQHLGPPEQLSMANSQLRCDWHLEQTGDNGAAKRSDQKCEIPHKLQVWPLIMLPLKETMINCGSALCPMILIADCPWAKEPPLSCGNLTFGSIF